MIRRCRRPPSPQPPTLEIQTKFASARGEAIIQSTGGENSNDSADTLRLWN